MSDLSDPKEKLLIEFAICDRELFIKTVQVLRPEYFEKPLNKAVDFINTYFAKYHNIPDHDVIKAETGIELEPRTVDSDEFDYVTDEIETHCRNAAMRLAIIESVEKHLENNEFSEIEDKIRKALTVSIDKSLGLSLFDDPQLRLMRMQENIDSRSIGWLSLDEMIDEIRRGELVIFAAGTGGGKSVMLANVGNNLCSTGLNVLYISFELKDDLIAKRLDSMITEIPTKEIFDNIEDVVHGLKTVEEEYGSFYVKKMPVGSNSLEIRNYLLEYHLQFGFYPDVILVDYLDLMTPNARVEGGRFEIDKAIAEQLREVFVDYNAYGFSASQLNRDSVDVQVKSQSHIAGGISKINTADAVIALSRTQEQIDKGEIELQALKLRNAEMKTFPITMFFDPKTLKISEHSKTFKFIRNKSAQPETDSGQTESTRAKLDELFGKKKG